MPENIEDWAIYQGILNRACAVLRIPYVVLSRFESETGMVHTVGMSGMQSQAFMRALRGARKVVPNFDIVGLSFHVDVNPLSRQVYRDAQVIEATMAETAAGIVNPLLTEVAGIVAGFRFSRIHPIVVDSNVVGALVFQGRQRFTESQRVLAAEFTRQVVLTWENLLLAQRLADQIRDLSDTRARVIAADPTLRLSEQPSASQLRYGDIVIDINAHTARRGNDWLGLTVLEFDLLAFFLRHPERPIDRDELAREVWKYQEVTSNFVDRTVMKLRRKLEPRGEPRLIHSARGRGYMLRMME